MGKDDNALISQVLRGDLKAYRTIVERHQARVFYLGLKFFHNPEDSEDFAQDVFLRCFEKLKTFRGKVPFSAWLYRIAINLAVNKYRFNLRRLLEAELDVQTLSHNYSPESKLLEYDLKERVREVLKELPDVYNVVLKMHYFEGFSYPEISEITEMPVNTIKSHIFRAKKIIKDKLAQYIRG